MLQKLPSEVENLKKDKVIGKLAYLIRWVFHDIIVNLKSTPLIWEATGLKCQVSISEEVPLGESQVGTLQLILVGIETFGRVMLGEKNNDSKGVSYRCFKKFIAVHMNLYKATAGEIYGRYRCGLLHSGILGYNSKKGFLIKRGPVYNHLGHTSKGNRLIINIDKFYEDFEKGVINLTRDICVSTVNNNELYNNAKKSLEDLDKDVPNLKQIFK